MLIAAGREHLTIQTLLGEVELPPWAIEHA